MYESGGGDAKRPADRARGEGGALRRAARACEGDERRLRKTLTSANCRVVFYNRATPNGVSSHLVATARGVVSC